MRTILVSGASGVVGYGILRSLKKSGKQLNLIGTTMYADSVAPRFCDIFELAPATNDANYIDWLLKIIRRHRVDLIMPGIEIDVFKWVEHRDEIESEGTIALLNKTELVNLCKDKWAFYENLSQTGIPCVIESSLSVDFDELKSRFALPFLLKPRRGFGARGIVKVDSRETFLRHQKEIGQNLMAQPIVGNDEEEFTTSAFCNGSGGFFASMTLRRKLSMEGFTEKAEVVVDDIEFREATSQLCELYSPIGPTNFQFRRTKNSIKLLEINPRISSATSIRTAFGYNENAMAVDYFLERRNPIQPEIKRGRAVRYIDEQIFYEDSVHI